MDLDKLVPMTGDIILNDPTLESNSTFDIERLNKAMRQIAIESYGNLYNVQKCKVGLVRFDVPFNEFIEETRFPGQSATERYPKQYVHYFKYSMINVGREEAYRRSDVYEQILTMETIATHSRLFDHNFLVFIDGKLITTCELYPMVDTTRISIDVANRSHTDGISEDNYDLWEAENPMVTVLFVPNFDVVKTTTNLATLRGSGYTFDKTRFPVLDRVGDYDGIWTFVNVDPDPAVCVKTEDFFTETENGQVTVASIFNTETTTINIWSFCFRHGLEIGQSRFSGNHYFQAQDYQFPVPTENMVIFSYTGTNTMELVNDYTITKYYPNMYQLVKEEDEENEEVVDYCVDLFYDNRLTTEA